MIFHSLLVKLKMIQQLRCYYIYFENKYYVVRQRNGRTTSLNGKLVPDDKLGTTRRQKQLLYLQFSGKQFKFVQ